MSCYAWGHWDSDCTASSTGATWTSWNNTYSSCSITITADAGSIPTDAVWFSWNEASGATFRNCEFRGIIRLTGHDLTFADCTISSDQAWQIWVGDTYVMQPPIQEQIFFGVNEDDEARAKRRTEAEDRAMELLEDLLSEPEMETYRKTGRVVVKGERHTYLIRKECGDVGIVQGDSVIDCCMHIDDHHGYVRHDNVISMKLFLEAREQKFLSEANRRGGPVKMTDKDAEALRMAV